MATISDTEFHFWAEFQITLLHAYIAPQIQTSNWKAKKAIFVLFYNSKKNIFLLILFAWTEKFISLRLNERGCDEN